MIFSAGLKQLTIKVINTTEHGDELGVREMLGCSEFSKLRHAYVFKGIITTQFLQNSAKNRHGPCRCFLL